MDLYLDMMTDQYGLSPLAVALVLTSVAVLAMVATYFAEKRDSGRLFLWLAAIWLLACVLAFGINPITWPFRTA
jgi:membrane protein YdbS with pleckstrin-like domain